MLKINRLPGETREDAERRARQEAQAAIEARRRKELTARRKLLDHLRVWKFCAHKRCRRACTCSGDPEACFKRFWPHVPEEFKVEIRASITAAANGMSPQAAARHGREERLRYLEMENRFAQETAERAAANARRFDPPQPRTIPDHLAPRIRWL